MSRGKVVATDSVDNLTRRFSGGDKIVLQVEGDLDALRAALAAVPGVEELVILEDSTAPTSWRCEIAGPTDVDLRPRLASVVVQGGWQLLGMSRTELSLEDIFLRLTDENDEFDTESTRAA